MANYQVTRSINISASIETIHASLLDYKQWSEWSPWLIIEPDARLEYSDRQGEVGSNYHWEGELIGSGSMELEKIADTRLVMKITFLSPFKSTAEVVFDLESEGDETKVTWNMMGSVPFFLRLMLKKIKAYIGMDYERGLRLLKEYIEVGVVSSSVVIEGVVSQSSQHYIGIANECEIKEMAHVMPADFKKLYAYLENNGLSSDGAIFAIYNDFDLVKQHACFISAIAIETEFDVEVPFIKGELESAEVVKVTHTGSYSHLGNGWAAAMGYARAKDIKTKKLPVGVEYYLNDPSITPESDLLTDIVLPVQ